MTSPLPVPELPPAAGLPKPAFSRADDIVLAGCAALLMLGALAFGAVEPWSIFILESGAAALLLVWTVGSFMKREATVAASGVFPPMLAFLGLICIQLLPGVSAYRWATLSSLLRFACFGTIVFLLTQTFARTRHVRRAAYLFSGFGSAVAIFAILQSLSSPGKLYWIRTPRLGGWIYGPYVNHNHYAGVMEMLVPIPLVFAFSRYAQGRRKWAAAAAAALMGATIFLSGSRAGMAAFAGQLAVFFWLVFREREHGRAGPLMGVFLVGSLLLTGYIGGNEVSSRIATITSHQHSDITRDIRGTITRDTLRMFLAHPILGWGAGTFRDVYPQYRSMYTNSLVDHAHNDYAELMAESGIAGVAIAGWFLFEVLRGAARKLRGWPSDVNGMVSAAALTGILGLLAHSLVDFNLQIPANAVFFYSLCGVAAMEPRFRNARREHRRVDALQEELAVQT
jgi:O-antigen ligase